MLVGALGTGDDAIAGLERTPVRDALVAAGNAAIPALNDVLVRSPAAAIAAGAAYVIGEVHAVGEAGAIINAMRRGALPTASALHALAGAGTPTQGPGRARVRR